MATNNDITPVRQRKYLAKDFNSLRAMLLEYARLYYPDKLKDFSEASLGGLFLDLAAYVGDNMSFYLDHQYSESNPTTSIETQNIQTHLELSNVPIVGSSPAIAPVTVYIQIPAVTNSLGSSPDQTCLPVIQANTVFSADNGTEFILLEDIDFNKKRSDGTPLYTSKIGSQFSNGTPRTFILTLSGICVSGKNATDSFIVGTSFVPFRQYTLNNQNVSEIISVTDTLGNIYHKVSSLSHDVVYQNVLNTNYDNDIVPEAIKVIPAPYRYITSTDLGNRKTTLTFGGGSADTLDDDIIPDPSEFAISFPYTKTFSRISVDPQKLLQTKTLGVAATNVTLNIDYRYGGGLNHSVGIDSIKTVKTLQIYFPGNPQASIASQIKNTIECTNLVKASGGEDAPTTDELKALIPSMRNSQERIVTKEDLIARVYTIPTNFGRVFRAAIRSNENNPLATQLFIVSRTPDGKLITSPDTLKQNLVKYLKPYRMISDAIDILDSRIINISLKFEVVVDPSLNKSIVLQGILTKLQNTFNIKNYHIDQPIIISNITNIIGRSAGVLAVDKVEFGNLNGVVNGRTYCDSTFDIESNTRQNMIIPPPGGIFEMKFPEVDIVGKAS